MKQRELNKNSRGRVVVLALLATLLLSVQVCSAYHYQVNITPDRPSIYTRTQTKVWIQVYDSDHPDWVFPNADVNISYTLPTGKTYYLTFLNKTDSTGLLWFTMTPSKPGNITFFVRSTYDYNTTAYVQAGNQSATSYPVNLTVSYKTGKVGVFRNSTHLFYHDLNGNGVWNGAVTDRQYNFGITGDIPVFGEWNGTTLTEIGVFRPSTHTFYLDYDGNGVWNGAAVDKQYNFGMTGDIPVSADWNIDGIPEIGVFRPSTHMFYLDYNGNGVWNGASVDKQYNFGINGDTPVSGDWNFDGIPEIGVFRPSTHLFYLDYNGNGIWNGSVTDRQYNFGITGDTPIIGDWK